MLEMTFTFDVYQLIGFASFFTVLGMGAMAFVIALVSRVHIPGEQPADIPAAVAKVNEIRERQIEACKTGTCDTLVCTKCGGRLHNYHCGERKNPWFDCCIERHVNMGIPIESAWDYEAKKHVAVNEIKGARG